MYVISSAAPDSGYTAETQLALPDGKWAIDGTMFTFGGQRWFVWSGWSGDTNVEQNLYIARMSSPTTPTGARHVISQPREGWERVVGNPYINEAPEAIKDPNGQLHIVYSANGSWSDQYCLAELRLRAGGDPTYVWDWYKSNGCLFGSNRATMMSGWDPTQQVNGPGHHSFVLLDGDINTSPCGRSAVPADVPRGPEGNAVLLGQPVLVHRHLLLVGRYDVQPRQRTRSQLRHRLEPQVLRVRAPRAVRAAVSREAAHTDRIRGSRRRRLPS